MGTLVIKNMRHEESAALQTLLEQSSKPVDIWELTPVPVLKAIINQLEDARVLASEEQARKTAGILLGAYPHHKVADPVNYSRGIISVLQRFPASIGAQATDSLTLQSEYLPTRAQLMKHCETKMGKINAAYSIAKRMVQEHQRRSEQIKDDTDRARARAEFRDKHGDKSPMEVLAAEGISIGNNNSKGKT